MKINWDKELERRKKERKEILKGKIEYEEMMNKKYGKRVKEYRKKSRKIENTPHYTKEICKKLFTDLHKEYPDLVEARLAKNRNVSKPSFPAHLQYKVYPDEVPDP